MATAQVDSLGKERFAAPARVLVVDDDQDAADAVSALLTRAGFQVGHAANGIAGLEHLRTHGLPAVILLDWYMPIMGGGEMMQVLQAEPTWRTIPVVLVTADPAAKTLAVEMRAVGYIKKPFAERDLLTMVDETLRHPS